MSEVVGNEPNTVILQGEMNPSQWNMLSEYAFKMGAIVMDRSHLVDMPEAIQPNTGYFGRTEFTDFAIEKGIKPSQGIRAYNGLMRIYFEAKSMIFRTCD